MRGGWRGERGASLLATLVAVGILGLVAAAFASLLTFTQRANKHSEFKDELVGLRRVLRQQVNCATTLAGQSCDGVTRFALLDAHAHPIGKPHLTAWKLGNFDLSATCSSSAKAMTVQFARLKTQTTFYSDPMNGSLYSWTTLYDNGDLACSSFWSAPPSCTGPICPRSDGSYELVTAALVPQTVHGGCNGGG